MAQIHEEVIIIKVSQLVKAGEQPTARATADVAAALASVAEELLGAGVVVEVETA
jgi:hypothetical protein